MKIHYMKLSKDWNLVIESIDGIITSCKHTKGWEEKFELPELEKKIIKYLNGDLRLDDIPVRYDGTPFQVKVWRQLKVIPYGETRTYKDIAIALKMNGGYQAVGSACNKNKIGIFIPCHRVTGKKRYLFLSGKENKVQLFRAEGIE